MRRFGLLIAIGTLSACVQILGDDFEIDSEDEDAGQGGAGPGAAGPGGMASTGGTGPGGEGPLFGHQWSQRYGGPAAQYLADLDVRDNGGLAVAGSFADVIAMGPHGATASSASWDGFYAKLDADGVPEWLVSIPGTGGGVNPQAVAVDSAGATYVAGFFEGQTDFGEGPWQSSGDSDAFLVKRDLNGGYVWSTAFFGPQPDYAIDLDVGDAGLAVVGNYALEIDLGGGLLTSAGASPMFLGAFDHDGQHLASQTYGNQGSVLASAVALDGAGHLYVAGAFDYVVVFGGDAQNAVGGQLTAFLAKLEFPSLNAVWAKSFGTMTGATQIYGIDARPDRVAITGAMEGAVDFGGGGLPHAGASDAFVAVFDADGNHLGSRAYGDHLDQEGRSIAWLPDGELAFAGNLQGTISTEAGDATAAPGNPDAFFIIASEGVAQITHRFGSDDQDMFPAVAATPDQGAIFALSVPAAIDLGGGSLPPQGGLDLALAKFR